MSGLTIDNPVQFSEALAGNILPGDKVRLLDGVYRGAWDVPWQGTEAAPIMVEPVHPGAVTIDGSLKISGAHTHWKDLLITDTGADWTIQTAGVSMAQPGTWLTSCKISALRSSGISWMGSGAGKVIECWIVGNGWLVGDTWHGHGIYTHNNSGGEREIARCLIGDTGGKYGLHAWSGGDNWIRDYYIHDCIILQPVIIGGGLGVTGLRYEDNHHLGAYHFYLGTDNAPGVDSGVVKDNHLTGWTWLCPVEADLDISGNINIAGDYTVDMPFTLSAIWRGARATWIGNKLNSEAYR